MERQVFDVDFILAKDVFGTGQIITEQGLFSFRDISIHTPLFKSDANVWLLEQLQQGIPEQGIYCDEQLVSRLGCVKNNRIVQLRFSPEKLLVTFDIDPVLLETSSRVKTRYLSGSSVQESTMVADYSLNQSFSSGHQHHNLRLGGILAFGERHIRTSFQGVLNRNDFHTSEYGELRDLYFRNDKKGRHLTFGLQEMRSFYGHIAGGGLFYPREDTIALSWGYSPSTDNHGKSSSVFPVQVFMPESGRAEVFLDGALLATEAVDAGITDFKTDYWPQGVYEVEITTWISGKFHDTQRQMVFKDGSGYSGKTCNLWLGTTAPDRRRIYGDDDLKSRHPGYQAIAGGSFSYPVTEGISINSAVHLSGESSALEFGTRIFLFGRSPFSANIMMTENKSFGGTIRLSGSLGKTLLAGSYEYFEVQHRQDRNRFTGARNRLTGNMIFSPARKQQLVFSIRQDFFRNTFSEAIDYRRQWGVINNMELESQLSIQHGNRLKERYKGGDFLASSGFSINLVLTLFFGSSNRQARSRMALQYRNAHNRHFVLNGSHSRYYDNSLFQDMTLVGKVTRDEQDFWGLTSFSSSVVKGSAGTTYYTGPRGREWGLFSNLSGQIGVTGSSVSFGQGSSSAAALLNVSDSGRGQLQANINGRPYTLEHSQSLIPLQPYQTHRVKISRKNTGTSQDILQLNRDSFLGTVYPGNIITFDIDAWYAVDVLGWVIDESGQPVSGLVLVNSRSQAMTSQAGMFSMTFDRTSLTMTGRKGGKSCEINISDAIRQQGRQPFYRLQNIPCHLH